MRATLSALIVLAAAILGGCASGPKERTVRAQFACADGRKLLVAFNLDAGVATVKLSRKESVSLPVVPGAHGRNYAGSGYLLRGVGDSITFTMPTGTPETCTETR